MPSLKELLKAKPAAQQAEPGLKIRKEEPAAPAPEPRQLGLSKGEEVPFEFPSEKDSEGAREWLAVRQAYETTLGIWIEPGGEHAWLAAESSTEPGKLVLIHRLPLKNKTNPGQPF